MWRILAHIFIWCVPMMGFGADLYVAKTGLDSNPGTIGSPFLTVQKGVNTAVAGQTIFVGAGTYAETVTSARGGGNGNPIQLDGQNVATLQSFLTTHSNIVIKNFTFQGKASGWWIFMGKGGHFMVISNNIFDGDLNDNADRIIRWDNPQSGELPFGTNCASGALIISNIIQNVRGTPAIEIFGDTNTVIGNIFRDSDAVDWVHLWGRSNHIVANLFTNAYVSGLSANHPDWVQTFGLNGAGATDMIIESNIVANSQGESQLCMFEGQDDVFLHDFTFRNNLFIGVSSKGTMVFPRVFWYNNTFIRCATNPLTAGPVLVCTSGTNATYTNFYASSGHSCLIYNNLFIDCGNGTTNKISYSVDANITNTYCDYNFTASSNYHAVVADPSHRAVGDAGGWDKFAWYEPHGINGGNPKFYDLTNLDLRLQALSPASGVGTNIGIATDFRGTPRSGPYVPTSDIGAFQYLNPLTYLATNPVTCDVETRALMGIIVSAPDVNTIAWPTNFYGNIVQIYRRIFTNAPLQWANWNSIYTNSGTPISAGLFNDTNVTTGIHYEYRLQTDSTNSMCGTNGIDFGYYAFTYLNTGWKVPLRERRGNVILLCEQGITNALNAELTNLVSDLRGDGYKVYQHNISAVDVPTNGTPGAWFTAVTNTKALVVADYATAPTVDWTLFIVGHVPIPYSGDNSPGFHTDNLGAHPTDWFYVDTNSASWTDSSVNDVTSNFPSDHNIPSDGKWDQNALPTAAEIRLGRVDLRNMPAFGLTEVQLLSQYLNRDHQWRHKQFTVRDRAMVQTNDSNSNAPYEIYGTYSQLFGNGTYFDLTNWLTASTNITGSYLMASSHGAGHYDQDLLIGYTTNFAASKLYSAFNSMHGSYYGDWDSAIHTNDVMMASLCTTGYGLGVYYREQQVDMNPSSMGEPYADDFFFQACNNFAGSSAKYIQNGYWYTNGGTFLNPLISPQYAEYFGDPTLRIRQVDPPSAVIITPVSSDNVITWTASSDSGLQGYHIYRAPSSDLNNFTKLTTAPTNSPYSDTGSVGTDYTYMVRAVKLQQWDARSYYDASQGAFNASGGASGPSPSYTPSSVGRGRSRDGNNRKP